MKYSLAVFDMDGTILDTLDDLTDTLNMSLAEVGMPVRTKDEVRSFVGNGVGKLLERAVPGRDFGRKVRGACGSVPQKLCGALRGQDETL